MTWAAKAPPDSFELPFTNGDCAGSEAHFIYLRLQSIWKGASF